MQREGFHPTPPDDRMSNFLEFHEFGKAHAICRQGCANENAVRSNCEARQGRQHVVPVPRFASVWWLSYDVTWSHSDSGVMRRTDRSPNANGNGCQWQWTPMAANANGSGRQWQRMPMAMDANGITGRAELR